MKTTYQGAPASDHKPQSKSVWVVVNEAGLPIRAFVTKTAAMMYAGAEVVKEYVAKQ
jgi:hypothetical protein